MSANRDLARSLLAAARRRANKFTRDQEARSKRKSRSDEREITGDYQGPQLLNQSLDELINERGWQEKMRDSDLFIKWGELVGAEIAEHVQPLSFSEGVLTLSAESTAWATQIRLIHDQIRSALARGGFEVSELLVKGPNAPSWRKGGWSVKGGRGPRDTYG
jgi:predicted nucleic acid-binding Zn ribbon protein